MAFLVWGFGSSLGAQTLVSDSLLQARAHWVWTGGALWGSQPTWGVNWHGFSMALWGHCLHCGEMEWALGAQTEGSPVWRETQAWLGLGKNWGDRIRGALRMNVGWASWPEVQRHVPLVDLFGQVHQRETWGDIRLEARATLGQGLPLAGVTEQGLVRTAQGAFGWTAWWKPNLESGPVGLPALGWSEGGAWHVAWGLDPGWWDGMRPWKPMPGRVVMQWSWPAGQWTLSWSGRLGREMLGATTRRSKSRVESRRDAFGVLFRRVARFHGGSWWWTWERQTNDVP